MYTSKLSDFDLENFKNIHYHLLPKRNKDFNKTEFTYPFDINDKNQIKRKTIVEPIIKKACEILDNQSINNYDKNYYYIEFHQRNCGIEKKIYKPWLTWHEDDYGAVPYKVYSILFYLRKDISIKGGNLLYKINNIQNVYNVEEGNILSFRGDFIHIPEKCTGFGCRDLIVVFVKRN